MSRRRVPTSDPAGEDLVVRWRRMRAFGVPACDPPLPQSHPRVVFGRRCRDLVPPGHCGLLEVDPARAVAAAEKWLEELGLTERFAEFDAYLSRAS